MISWLFAPVAQVTLRGTTWHSRNDCLMTRIQRMNEGLRVLFSPKGDTPDDLQTSHLLYPLKRVRLPPRVSTLGSKVSAHSTKRRSASTVEQADSHSPVRMSGQCSQVRENIPKVPALGLWIKTAYPDTLAGISKLIDLISRTGTSNQYYSDPH